MIGGLAVAAAALPGVDWLNQWGFGGWEGGGRGDCHFFSWELGRVCGEAFFDNSKTSKLMVRVDWIF